LNNAFVILDEAQNTTSEQMLMFLRAWGRFQGGDHRRHHTSGPARAQDIGLIEIQGILTEIPGLKIVYFDEHDVVRHELVQKIISAYSKFKEERERRRQESAANGNGKPHTA